jgi:hypothetical protein
MRKGISVTVGDTTENRKPGAGPSVGTGIQGSSWPLRRPGAVTSFIGLPFSIRLKQRTDGRFGGAEIQIPLTKASKISKRAPPDWMPLAKAFWPPMWRSRILTWLPVAMT